jgi:hypothetical protein
MSEWAAGIEARRRLDLLRMRWSSAARDHPRLAQLLREVALVGGLFALYNVVRLLAAQRVSGAFDNADQLLRVERWLNLPSEQTVQALALNATDVVRAANGYYASVHFPLTFLFLLWLFLRRPRDYIWARRSLVLASAVALLVQVFWPLAPPRMLSELGYVDTALAYGQSVYGAVGDNALSNQFAAMPSLHVGWALLVAIVCIRCLESPWRWLWVLHPVVTTLVVVVTANHYWLDGALGALLVVGALRFTDAGDHTAPSESSVLGTPERVALPAPRAVSDLPRPAAASADQPGSRDSGCASRRLCSVGKGDHGSGKP